LGHGSIKAKLILALYLKFTCTTYHWAIRSPSQ